MEARNLIEIEVVYAEAGAADRVRLTLEDGTLLGAAIERSGLLQRHPELDWTSAACGVFGRLRGPHEAVRDGDRIEIYRPLAADPKLARRQRVRLARRKTR